jgi:putative Mn2+ efflux pump MntP
VEFVTTVLIALGLAADAFAVSVTSGLAIKHLKPNKALKIALFFGGFQAVMPLIGWGAGSVVTGFMTAIDHWIAFAVLVFLGGKMIYEACREDGCDRAFNPLDNGVLLALAIATSLDALAVGFSFAVLNADITHAAAVIGFVTSVLCFSGVFIGHRFGNILRNRVELCGGILLIAIGGKILFEHLTAPIA